MMRCLYLFVLAVSPLVLGTGCGNRPAPAVAPKGGEKFEEPAKSKPADAKPISVSAEQYYKDSKDPAASKKYENAIVEIEGEVFSLNMANDGTGMLTLKAGPGSLDTIMMMTAEKAPWEKVAVGQKVKVVGKVSPVYITDAKITEAPGLPAPISSETLAAENTSNNEAAAKKYGNKSLVVTGVVTKKEDYEVFLKDDGKTKILARFDGFSKTLADTVKVGDTIKIHAKAPPVLIQREEITFYLPLLMK